MSPRAVLVLPAVAAVALVLLVSTPRERKERSTRVARDRRSETRAKTTLVAAVSATETLNPRERERERERERDVESGTGPSTAEAIVGLQRLAVLEPQRAAESRGAVLAIAEQLADGSARADALEGLRVDGATDAELARIERFLDDPEPIVRAATARTLRDVDASARARTAVAIERTRARERDPDVTAELDSALDSLTHLD